MTSLPGDGTLKLSGTNATTNQVITNITSGLLTFVPSNNSTTAGSFQFNVTDSVNGRTSAAAATMSITIGNSVITVNSNNGNYNNYNDYQVGQYQVENGWWGAAGSNGVSNWITLSAAIFPSAVTFHWNWPAVSPPGSWGPQCYPDMIYVHQWTNGNGGGTNSLYSNETPTTLSNLNTLTATYNISITGDTADVDVAYDIWITDSSTANPHNPDWSKSAPETEIMIFVHSPTAFGSASPGNEPT